jgi:hypothetical protein
VSNPNTPTREHGTPHRIEITLADPQALFTSRLDEPFREEVLDADAEVFIEQKAATFPRHASLMLMIHLPVHHPDLPARIEQAVHAHFALCARRNRESFTRLMAEGRRTLLVGFSFLILCLLLAAQVFTPDDTGVFGSIMHESLVIAGWVALWRPLEICLYDWWPIRKRGRLLHKLATMPVHIRFAQPATNSPP